MQTKNERAKMLRASILSLGLVEQEASTPELIRLFKREFKERAPDSKTLNKLFSDESAVLETVTEAIFQKVEKCVSISNRHFKTYRAQCESLGITPEAEELASTICGDFIFYRLDVEGQVTSGGIRLTSDYGVNRFWHFNDAGDFRK